MNDVTTLHDERCTQCLQIYEVTRITLSSRARGKARCRCGKLLRIWNEPAWYRYALIEPLRARRDPDSQPGTWGHA